jgi:hypothetical protein
MFKDYLSFIYNTMDTLRKEIEQELKRTRLDKGRLYGLLLKIIDNAGAGGPGGVGPQGPAGPPARVVPVVPPVLLAPPVPPVPPGLPVSVSVSLRPLLPPRRLPLKKKTVTA